MAALQRLGITQIAYSGDTHVGTAWAPDMPGGSPHGAAWETHHAVHSARWHVQMGFDHGQWEERPVQGSTKGWAPRPYGVSQMHATRTHVFCTSSLGFACVHVEGAAQCQRAPSNSSSSCGKCSGLGSILMWYRVVPYAERQFLSSLTTGPDTPANGSSDRYIADLPRGVVAANLALLRHRPRRVGRMKAKRWALRRNTETTGIISSNDAKLSDNNSRGLENCYGDDHEKKPC